MIFEFLWEGKRDKIKRTTVIGNKLDGGLEVPDFNYYSKTMKLKWVNYLTNPIIANWKIIPSLFLDQFGKDFLIFHMHLDSLKSLPQTTHKLSEFYKHLVTLWVQFKQLPSNQTKLSNNYYNIRKEIIWGNKYIKVE